MTDYKKMSSAEFTAWRNSGGNRVDAPTDRSLVPYSAPLLPLRSNLSGKAVTSLGPWATGVTLSSLANTPQSKAAAYLRAYKVGWFYKAGKKIADDVASLDWSVSDGDAEEGEDETVLDRPKLSIPFDSLTPIEQFMRLMERPNPSYTGRQLMRKTQVRLDFAGAAFWYLENGTGLLPTAIYGISPTRMWPSYDDGGRLIGWVMDKDSTNPVPFDVDEILPFATGSAEDGEVWGVSVVEAVYAQVPLTDLMARHTADVLTTGGRMAGMMWPKERALDEAEFQDAQRAWRNATSSGDAAKRLLIFPEPMEYASGASTPAEIGIPELATLNRDEILTAFPLSPYQLGVPMPGGLNSAETRREDRKDYWEGTIHPRADLIEEAIQVNLLSRYEEVMGQTFDFEIAEPNMDDAPSIMEKVAALRALASSGFDEKESVRAVGLDHIKFTGIPLPDPAELTANVGDGNRRDNTQVQATAGAAPKPAAPPSKAEKAREDTANKGQRSLEQFLADQMARVIDGITRTYPAKAERKAWASKTDPEWWDAAKENDELRQTLRVIYVESARGGLQVAADALGRVVLKGSHGRVVDDLLSYGGERIKDINARTLQRLTIELAEGTRRGYSITQLVEGVADEGFAGIKGLAFDNGLTVFGDLRAETIARTETALSYNRSSLLGYKEFAVRYVEAIDGHEDADCQDRDGKRFEVDEALTTVDHPNGTLDWVPVTDKSWHEPAPAPIINLTVQNHMAPGQAPDVKVYNDIATPAVNVAPAEVKVTTPDVKVFNDVAVPETVVNVAGPVVNVEQPDITVNTPDVHVTSPDIHVAPAQVHMPDIKVMVPEQLPPVVNVEAPAVKAAEGPMVMHIASMPDRVTRRKVGRDKQGHITDTTDIETDG